MLFSIGVPAEPDDRFSQCVTMFGGPTGITMHRVLAFTVSGDGSLYFTLMKPVHRSWMVGHAPPKQEFLSRDVDTSKIVPEGTTSAPKVSFHASGAVNFGRFRKYRPPLRTVSRLEQLCLCHFGDPRQLPEITTDEFNNWQQTKGHPILPAGTPFPGGVVATRIFVAPPSGFESHKQRACPDFEVSQQNLIISIRGLDELFPPDESGAHGYDLVLSTGQWQGADWKGPLIIVPATNLSDDPEAARKGHAAENDA
jgi:hypothetical protein